MKKKIIISIVIIALVILLFPIRMQLKDGGSVEYRAILYNVTKYHKLDSDSTTGYMDGIKIKLLGFTVYNHKNFHNEDIQRNYDYNSYKGYFFELVNIVEKVTNKEQITEILSKINNLPEDLIDKLETYDETYFASKDLLFIYFSLGSGSTTTNLKNIKVSDKINVYIDIDSPEFGTADMSGYLYLIEIDKTNKPLNVYLGENNIQSGCEFSKTYEVIDVKDHDICQTVTLKSFTKGDTFVHSHCNTDYIKFEKNKKYKFTFTAYENHGPLSVEDSIRNMFLGGFINTKIEETTDIINEEICGGTRCLIETNNSNSCNNTAKEYTKTNDYDIYTYCTDEIYVIEQNKRNILKNYLISNPTFVDDLISKMEYSSYGNMDVYKSPSGLSNHGLTIVKCQNTIYLSNGYLSMEKEEYQFCEEEFTDIELKDSFTFMSHGSTNEDLKEVKVFINDYKVYATNLKTNETKIVFDKESVSKIAERMICCDGDSKLLILTDKGNAYISNKSLPYYFDFQKEFPITKINVQNVKAFTISSSWQYISKLYVINTDGQKVFVEE